MKDLASRRGFLLAAGVGSAASAWQVMARPMRARPRRSPGQAWTLTPRHKHHIRFSVIGLDHYHIMSMTAAVKRGGGELVYVYGHRPQADRRLPQAVRRCAPGAAARTRSCTDKSIQLVAAAPIPDQRTPLGLQVMAAGKDYLADKPGIITLEQLAQVRAAVKKTWSQIRDHVFRTAEVPAAVKAGELVQAGAIGKVVQTVNLAPHRIGTRPSRLVLGQGPLRRYPDRHRLAPGRPVPVLHRQQDGQGGRQPDRQRATTPSHPKFEDFGDMTAVGDGGAGYVRVDWFGPTAWASGATAGSSCWGPRAISSCAQVR